MHSLRALQGAQLGRSLAGIVDIAQYGHCLSCSRWFSQEPKPNGQGIDPKTSSSSESTTATAMKDTLTKENERKAAESAAQSVTAAMFPWERRQMDGEGTPLNRFERVYWIAFAGAAAFIAGSNIYRYFTVKKEVVVDEDLTKQKEDMAMKLSAGSVNVLECEDLFEGLSPEEVSDFVEGARNKKIRERHSASDEYDGLSPEEINKLKR